MKIHRSMNEETHGILVKLCSFIIYKSAANQSSLQRDENLYA